MLVTAALLARALLSPPEAPTVAPSTERDYAEVVELRPPPAREPVVPPSPEPKAPPAEASPEGAPAAASDRPRRGLPGRLRAKGHRFVVVPSFRADPSIGAMPGLRFRYVLRRPGRTYNSVQADLGLRLSTKLVHQHDLRIRLRDLAGRDELFQVGAVVSDDPVFPYFGIQNEETLHNRDLARRYWQGDVLTLGGFFNYQQPAFRVEPEKWGHPLGVLRWLVGVDFQADRIRIYDDTRLAEERPEDAGWTRRGTYMGGITWDSRDNEWSPTWGGQHEATVALAGPWAGASAVWGRFNATFRWFRPLGTKKLVFAERLSFDALIGPAPLYELGSIGGLFHTEGFGGRDAGRGYFRRRFAGPVKGLSLTELRWQPFEWAIRKRTLGLGFKAFADLGELFHPDAILADGFHIAGGGGLYFVWDRFFILRGDVGFSPEGVQWYVVSNHAF